MEKFLIRAQPYLPPILVTILTLRIAAFGASFGDALASIGLVVLLGYKMFLDTKKVADPNAELSKELEKLKGEISTISIAVSQRKAQPPVNFRF